MKHIFRASDPEKEKNSKEEGLGAAKAPSRWKFYLNGHAFDEI
jgi:hypothetical protein